MECGICLREWQSEDCIPRYYSHSLICILNCFVIRLLSCGHSYCETCLSELYKDSEKAVKCPTCATSHHFEKKEEIRSLIKNFTLLTLASESQTQQRAVVNASKKLFNANEETKISGKAKKIESKPIHKISVEVDEKCKTHNLMVHSYIQNTSQILCDKCIADLNQKNVTILPIPQVYCIFILLFTIIKYSYLYL